MQRDRSMEKLDEAKKLLYDREYSDPTILVSPKQRRADIERIRLNLD